MSQPERIKVLVCTGNMGNRQPDQESIDAWIPDDGLVSEVVTDNPKYPIRKHLTTGANKFKQAVAAFIERRYSTNTPLDKLQAFAAQAAAAAKNEAENADDPAGDDGKNRAGKSKGGKRDPEPERFDIIVVGLQESTWKNERSPATPTSSQQSEEVDSSSDPARKSRIIGTSIHATKAATKKSIAAAKMSIQAAKTVQTLTLMDKDHTKKHKRKTVRIETAPPVNGDSNKSPLSEDSNRSTPQRDSSNRTFLQSQPSTRLQPNKGDDTHILHLLLRERLPSYTHEISYQRGEMRLMLFYLDFQCDLDVLSVKAQNTGRAGLANKGGIVAEVNINSGTRLAFMSAHLEAHEGESRYETRCNSVHDILRGTASSTTVCRCDASLASHFTFAMGDLNFRTRLPDLAPGSVEHIESTNALVEKKDYETLNRRDELFMALRQKDCFVGFKAPLCWFPPTFKVARGPGYEYNEKRSPSYTDRILYKASDQLMDKVKLLAFEPIDNFVSSDHKPIRGAFEVELNESLKWKPTLGERAKRMGRRVRQNARLLRVQIKDGNLIIGRSKRGKNRTHPVEETGENLHLFVSSISCTLEGYKDDYTPHPYVCFMTTPAEAIQRDISKLDTLKKALKINVRKQTKDDTGNITRFDDGFPRTRCIRNTHLPRWEDEEVHFKVKSHGDDGDPIDLTGAMMHIAVCDAKANSRLIGSFTLNLANLITTTRQRNDKAPKTPSASPQPTGFFAAMKFLALAKNVRSSRTSATDLNNMDATNHTRTSAGEISPRSPRRVLSFGPNGERSPRRGKFSSFARDRLDDISESGAPSDDSSDSDSEVDGEGNKRNSRVATNGPSDALRRVMDRPVSLSTARNQMRAALKRKSSERSVMSSARPATGQALDKLNIQSLRLTEPLLKNGKQVGRICCTIDSFWIDDKGAEGERMRRYNLMGIMQ